MNIFQVIINHINTVMWSRVLIISCALCFTAYEHFVLFRIIGERHRLLGDIAPKQNVEKKHISSFRAYIVSPTTLIGKGNLAGVGTTIIIDASRAVFWMWVIALLRSASAFTESTLNQLLTHIAKVREEAPETAGILGCW